MGPILVIDDDRQARGVVRSALERAGYEVREASDGGEGVRIARTEHPALVITDILMPNKEGLEVIRELKDENHALPIIAMSGGSQWMPPDAVLRLAGYFGARRTLHKPFSLADLLAAVRSVLEEDPQRAESAFHPQGGPTGDNP
jgi:DNA-binding response OmpR family regulator